jgi:signal transduction histidine kinase/DNA-binding response OmpR family regulator
MREPLYAAASASGVAFSGAVDLGGGVMGLLVASPAAGTGAPRSGTIGAIRFDTLVDRALAADEEPEYGIALFDGVRQVYSRTGAAQVSEEWVAEVPVGPRDTPLRLRVWPTPTRLAQLEGRMSSLILAGGLLLSAVLACMTFFAGTSRRRERQLREAADQLSEHMKARDAANAEISRARDAALESDRLKSEFVANVSHELRTPMNGILGLTELLLDTNLTPEQREHASTVRDCGETLLALLNDILDLSKVEAGKLEIQTVAFEPRRLVRQVVDLFQQRARVKGIDLVCLVHHDVPEWIGSDPGRFRQILTNLLGNAVKFTEQGEITVRVTSEPQTGGTAVLRIEVADTGIGISPEAQAQIFQPFVQADGSITRRYGGTGLGLVISRQLAGLLGGDMDMISRPGRGSTFWFTIRATVVAPSRPRREHADRVLRGVRILALDDSDTSRERVVAMLDSWQMAVTSEASTEGALSALKAAAGRGAPFDVALVDLRNVGATVLDFADAAHAAGLVPPVRLILMSGSGQRGDAQRAQQSGAAAYLTKPIGPSDLFDCLVTVLSAAPRAEDHSEPVGLVTRYTLESQQPSKPPLLVVEDNIINQKVMVGLLTKLGYRAEVAQNGIAALEALHRGSYPIVFMDSQMPVMDGFAATAEIRRTEGDSRRTIVVAVTAHAMKGERERCLAAGMDDYLSKPVSLDLLKEVIERWMPAHAAEPDPSADAPPEHGNASEAIDARILAQLRELEAGMPGLLADVMATFVRETPGRIARIATALRTGDGPGAEQAAHGLKGSAAAIGAQRLSALCAHIEECSRQGDLEACRSSVTSLTQEFDRARDELQVQKLAAS